MIDRNNSDNATLLFLRAVFRHRYRCGIFFAMSVVIAILVTALMPRTYRSEAKLFLRLGRENVALDPTATLGESSPIQVPGSREQEIKTVVELLGDRILSEQVVDQLTPAVILDPGRLGASGRDSAEKNDWLTAVGRSIDLIRSTLSDWSVRFRLKTQMPERQLAILAVEGNLNIEAVRDTNVIAVTYESPSAELSRCVVRTLLDAYLAHHAQINRTRGSHELLAERTQIAQDSLTAIEEQIAELKTKLNLASPEDERRALVQHIGLLEGQLAVADGEVSGARQKVLELTRLLDTLPETEVTSELEGVGDGGTDGMRQQYYALQLREAEMAAKFTDSHPLLIDVRRQRAEAAKILNEQSPTREQLVRAASPAKQQVRLAILAEQPSLKAAEARSDTLRQALTTARERLLQLGTGEAQLAKLERERDLRDIEYRQCVANYEKSQLDEAMEREGISNVAIAQEPTLEFRPVSPRAAVNLVLGVLVGFFGAIGLAVLSDRLDHSFRTPEDIEDQLQLPTLAVIPRLRSSQFKYVGRN